MPSIIGSGSICKIEQKPVVEGVVVTAVDRLFADDSVDGFDEVVAGDSVVVGLLHAERKSKHKHEKLHTCTVQPANRAVYTYFC